MATFLYYSIDNYIDIIYNIPMYIQIVPNTSPPCILLREDHRENGRVVKKTLANLTKLPSHAVEGLRRLLKEGPEALSGNNFKITRTLPHGHAVAILKVMKDLDIPRLISSRRTSERDLIVALIAQRILNPQSKEALPKITEFWKSLKYS